MTLYISPWIILMLGAYCIGSFPAGYLAGCCCGIDIRLHGSGSIGATNVVRVLNKKWGAAVFIIDFLKGLLPVLLATAWGKAAGIHPLSAPAALAAVFSLLGHSFPIWLRFRGGKGIATSAGIIIGMFPGAFLFCIAGWIFFFYLTRYVSVASIVAAILLPVSVAIFYTIGRMTPEFPFWFRTDWLSVVVATIMGLLVLWRHRSNMKRLFNGTELRFDNKASTTTST